MDATKKDLPSTTVLIDNNVIELHEVKCGDDINFSVVPNEE